MQPKSFDLLCFCVPAGLIWDGLGKLWLVGWDWSSCVRSQLFSDGICALGSAGSRFVVPGFLLGFGLECCTDHKIVQCSAHLVRSTNH